MKQIMYGLFAGLCLTLVMACGKSDGGNTAATLPPGTCNAGQGYTAQYGCLPQGSCQAGAVQYGTTCIAATNGAYGYGNTGYGYGNTGTCQLGMLQTQYGCLPQAAQCGASAALYNGQCIPAVAGGYGQTGYGSQCGVGMTYTMQGCLAQSSCPIGMGYFNGQCIQGMSTTGYNTIPNMGYGGYGSPYGTPGYYQGYQAGYPNYNPGAYLYFRF